MRIYIFKKNINPIKISGFGIYINSSWSGFNINNAKVESNGADGIRYLFGDAIPDQKLDGVDVFDLCTVPITLTQVYPIRMSLDQGETSMLRKECRKVYKINAIFHIFLQIANKVLTLAEVPSASWVRLDHALPVHNEQRGRWGGDNGVRWTRLQGKLVDHDSRQERNVSPVRDFHKRHHLLGVQGQTQ